MTTEGVIGHLIVQMPGHYSGVVAHSRSPGDPPTRLQRTGIDKTTGGVAVSAMADVIGLAA